MIINWQKVVVGSSESIKNVLKVIDKEAQKIALVVDNKKLIGVVTDGDVRRGILKGIDLANPINQIMNSNPLSANAKLSTEDLKEIMQQNKILSLPLVDDNGILVGLESLYDTLNFEKRNNPIFIMAGGFGTRLSPLTDHCPKPMLEVGGKPMLERLINNFKSYGFYKFYISIHYLPEVIRSYFGDGSQFGIEITYIHEEKPLGTAGALSLLPKSLPKDPLIMINGDILTNVDFSRVIDFHVKKKNDATMCVREYSYQIPYGVINGNGKHIISMMEKPTKRFFVNAGIYVLSHHVVQSVKKNQRIDMPDLLQLHINDHQNILMFPIHEYWLDIGRMEDFQKAQQDINLKA